MKKYILALVILTAVLAGGYVYSTRPDTSSIQSSTGTSTPTGEQATTDTASTTETPSKVLVAKTVSTNGAAPVTLTFTADNPETTTKVEIKKTFTMSEIAARNSKESCYSTINGSVYDLTSWISKHPGGSSAVLAICGKDGSSMFNGKHGGDKRPEDTLASFYIGTLTQ